MGDVRWNMSVLKAYQLALYSEQKAFAFYDEALDYVTQPDVRALFEELRDEETEHVNMLVKIIANLPKSAEVELEDEDYDENRPARDSFEA
jgi:rubrerythrin